MDKRVRMVFTGFVVMLLVVSIFGMAVGHAEGQERMEAEEDSGSVEQVSDDRVDFGTFEYGEDELDLDIGMEEGETARWVFYGDGTELEDIEGNDVYFNWRRHGDYDLREFRVEIEDYGNVFQIHWPDDDLTGDIPADLGDLTDLEYLNLGLNDLSGEIPADLGGLTNLESFRLGLNDLSGDIPSDLGELENLERLYLNRNDLSGEIPAELGDLTNLEDLNLRGNDLSGDIPADLGNLTNLTRLYPEYNDLSGDIPADLGDLTNLESLRLGSNDLSGDIPAELGNLENLERLFLYRNNLSGEIPSEFSDLTGLERVKLQDNSLDSYGEGAFSTQPYLGDLEEDWDILDLSNNEFTTEDVDSVLSDLVKSLDLEDRVPAEVDLTDNSEPSVDGWEDVFILEAVDWDLDVVPDEDEYELTIYYGDGGSVNIMGQEVEDGWTGKLSEGTEVTIEAVPEEGWGLDEWTVDDETYEEEEITVEMDENKTAQATFLEEFELTVDEPVGDGGEGEVYVDSDLVEEYPYTEVFVDGEEVALEAESTDRWVFDEWEGEVEEPEKAETTIIMDDDQEVTAFFEESEYVDFGTFEYGKDELDLDIVVEENKTARWVFYGDGMVLESTETNDVEFDWSDHEDIDTKKFRVEIEEYTDVLEIDWSDGHVKSELPLELTELENLEGLRLSDNNLSGEIPHGFSDLTEVEVLELQGNNFDGYGESAFSNQSDLGDMNAGHILNLSYNDLSAEDVDDILDDLNESLELEDRVKAEVDLRNNSVPSSAGRENRDILQDEGWHVHIDHPEFFSVEVEEYDEKIIEGDELEIEYIIKNTGSVEGEQPINVTINGKVEDNEEIKLGPGEKEEFTWRTNGYKPGEYEIEIASQNSSAKVNLTVLEDAFFELDITDHAGEIFEGEEFFVEYEVDNLGEIEKTQEIELKIIGEDDEQVHTQTEDLTVEAEGKNSSTFFWNSEIGDVGPHMVNVSSEDDWDEKSFEIEALEPAYLEIEDIPDQINAGEPFSIVVESYNEYGYLTPEKELTDLSVETDLSSGLLKEDSVTLDDEGAYKLFIEKDVLTQAGDHAISVSAQGIEKDQTEMTVEPCQVERVSTDPEGIKNISIDERLEFTAEALDGFENLITDDPMDFEWTGADNTGVFEKDEPRTYEVIVEYEGVDSSEVIVNVQPEGSITSPEITESRNVTLDLSACEWTKELDVGFKDNLTSGEKERYEYSDELTIELEDTHGFQTIFVRFLTEEEIRSEVYNTTVYYDRDEAELEYTGIETIIFEDNLEYELEWTNKGGKVLEYYEIWIGSSEDEMEGKLAEFEKNNITYEFEDGETVYFNIIGHDEVEQEHILEFNVTADLIDTSAEEKEWSEDEDSPLLDIDVDESRKDNITVTWYKDGGELERNRTYEPDLEPGDHVIVCEIEDDSRNLTTERLYRLEIEEVEEDGFFGSGILFYILLAVIIAVIIIVVLVVLKSKGFSETSGSQKGPYPEDQVHPPASPQPPASESFTSSWQADLSQQEVVSDVIRQLGRTTKGKAYEHLRDERDVEFEECELEENLEKLIREEKVILYPQREGENIYEWTGE